MEKVLLLVLPALVFGQSLRVQDDQPVVTAEMVDYINQQGLWTASLDQAKELTIGEARKRLAASARGPAQPIKQVESLHRFLEVPTSFNASEQWPDCIHPMRDQGNCSAGWALAAASAFSDRMCISSNGAVNEELSPQYMISCSTVNFGCVSGFTDIAWVFMTKFGIPLDSCEPYTSGQTGHSGSCGTDCTTFYHPHNLLWLTSPLSIQASLLASGPVQTTFEVFQDFFSYTGGVYRHTTGAFVANHSVKITGWGSLNGTNYWIAANSWGLDWGLSGYFLIAFGECQFDRSAIAGDFQAT